VSRALAAVEAAAVIAVAAAAAVVAMAVVALYGDVTTSMSGVRLGATRSGGSGGSESAMAVGDEGMEDAEGDAAGGERLGMETGLSEHDNDASPPATPAWEKPGEWGGRDLPQRRQGGCFVSIFLGGGGDGEVCVICCPSLLESQLDNLRVFFSLGLGFFARRSCCWLCGCFRFVERGKESIDAYTSRTDDHDRDLRIYE